MNKFFILCLMANGFLYSQVVDLRVDWTYNDLGQVDSLEWSPSLNDQTLLEFSYDSETQAPTDITCYNFEQNVEIRAFSLLDTVSFNEIGAVEEASSQDGTSYQTRYWYDSLGRRDKEIHLINGRDEYRASNFQYDEWGNISRYHKDHVATAWLEFGYNDQNMLQTFTYNRQGQVHYSYDKFGNMTSASGFSGSVLSMEDRGLQTFENNQFDHPDYEYDGAGRLTADETFFYDYRKDGKLAAVRNRKTGWVIASYKYDTSGNRVVKVNGEEVTYYSRDQSGNVLYEKAYRQDEQVSFKEYQAFSGGNRIRQKSLDQNQETTTRYFKDYLGSTIMRYQDGGNLEKIAYSPFGIEMQTVDINEGAYSFTGHEDDRETQQTYMHARYYQGERGRFTRPDPAFDMNPSLPATMNLYQYAYNNPINFTDPTGLNGKKANQEESTTNDCLADDCTTFIVDLDEIRARETKKIEAEAKFRLQIYEREAGREVEAFIKAQKEAEWEARQRRIDEVMREVNFRTLPAIQFFSNLIPDQLLASGMGWTDAHLGPFSEIGFAVWLRYKLTGTSFAHQNGLYREMYPLEHAVGTGTGYLTNWLTMNGIYGHLVKYGTALSNTHKAGQAAASGNKAYKPIFNADEVAELRGYIGRYIDSQLYPWIFY